MPKPFNVAIIGGGIAGITLAIALHHRQIPVTIYEQAPEFGEVGAGVSFGLLVGEGHPAAVPSFTHKYAYRGLVPMDKAVEAIGEELASNSCKTLNIVAFHTTPDGWAEYPRLTRSGTRDEVLRDFANYGPNVTNLLKLTDPELNVWAIYDLGDHPVPTFYKGRVCISGDAAHATSPHHGAGAGFCIEDSAILATLLEDERVQSPRDLEAVLATFDATRRERTQWLVQSSRFIGDTYEWRAPGVGDNLKRTEEEINRRNGMIANVDVDRMCDEAREELGRRLRHSTL